MTHFAEEDNGSERKVWLPSERMVIVGLGVVIAVLGLVALFALWRASRAGEAGEAQLLRAESDLSGERFGAARQDLVAADGDFDSMRGELHGLPFGPVLALWRAVPLVRVQVRAVDTFADVGASLSQVGLNMADAAETIEQPSGKAVALSASLDKLRTAQSALLGGLKVLDSATARIDALSHYRLIGPINSAERESLRRITKISTTATSAEQAVSALIVFTGGEGPRSYLVLSQNPDEVRPTGGFLGSYGVLTADGGHVDLARYDDIATWYMAHPNAVVPADQVGSPFRFYDPPLAQTLANVNSVPDWPQVAQLALKLWAEGGETPANGVVSFTPQFLARVLAVTGPVAVPSYGVTVTAGNVVSDLDYFTHQLTPPPGTNRKQFLSPLGQAVMTRLLAAPPSEWRGLGAAVSEAFAARDLQVWSQDPVVEAMLTQRGWAGAFPSSAGDFFYDSEFEYEAKNGGGLKRTFDDVVSLRADGSAQITTTITIDNTEAPNVSYNNDALTYYTLYGPPGAVLDTASDPPLSPEPTLAGHPAYGWFLAVNGGTTGTIKVVWDVPALAERRSDGSWQYSLLWWHIVDNANDVLHLQVDLPAGAHWVGDPPPTQVRLNHDVSGTWLYRTSS